MALSNSGPNRVSGVDEQLLEGAIRSNPEDDTPRLALADELQANGNEQRADFIRHQIALHNRRGTHGLEALRLTPLLEPGFTADRVPLVDGMHPESPDYNRSLGQRHSILLNFLSGYSSDIAFPHDDAVALHQERGYLTEWTREELARHTAHQSWLPFPYRGFPGLLSIPFHHYGRLQSINSDSIRALIERAGTFQAIDASGIELDFAEPIIEQCGIGRLQGLGMGMRMTTKFMSMASRLLSRADSLRELKFSFERDLFPTSADSTSFTDLWISITRSIECLHLNYEDECLPFPLSSLASLDADRSLTRLIIEGHDLPCTREIARRFVQSPIASRIRALEIRGKPDLDPIRLSDSFINALAHPSAFPALESLVLDRVALNPRQWRVLLQAERDTPVSHLALIRGTLDILPPIADITRLPLFRHLKALDLSAVGGRERTFTGICVPESCEFLALRGFNLDAVDLEALCNSATVQKLDTLDIAGRPLSGTLLAGVYSDPRISNVKLVVSNPGFPPERARALSMERGGRLLVLPAAGPESIHG